jgi:lysophospholipase L1-like esterase
MVAHGPRILGSAYCFFFVLSALSSGELVRVAAMGDSITQGGQTPAGDFSSYREPLWQLMVAEGFADGVGTDVDMVGPWSDLHDDVTVSGTAGFPLTADPDHAGWWGARAGSTVNSYLDSLTSRGTPLNSLLTSPPDIALLHLGLNDIRLDENRPNGAPIGFGWLTTVLTTVDEMHQIVDALQAANPNISILIGQLGPMDDSATFYDGYDVNSAIQAFNHFMRNTFADAPNVWLIDHWTDFAISDDTTPGPDDFTADPSLMTDALHPSRAGDTLIAENWWTGSPTGAAGLRSLLVGRSAAQAVPEPGGFCLVGLGMVVCWISVLATDVKRTVKAD